MKKRILSGILSLMLIVGCLADLPVLPVFAKTDAQAAAEDVTITTTDVDVKDVEWKKASSSSASAARSKSAARKHEIVMVMDVSGSMSGDPMTEMKKACRNFVDDILNEDSTAGIAIVTFASDVKAYTYSGSYFTSDRNQLRSTINSLSAGGGTAMNAGLRKADEIIQQQGAANDQIIIQMADGEPGVGKSYTSSDARYYGTTFTDPYGQEFTYSGSEKGYASEVYNTFQAIAGQYNIYSLGFFHSLSGTQKQFAGTFLNDVQNQAYFEVENADLLSFSFESIAEKINTDYLVLNKSNLSLSAGDSEQLTVTFSSEYPSEDKTVTWGSDDSKVAKVSSSGLVTGVSAGQCTITAQADNYQVTCPVTVGGAALRSLPQTIQVYQNEKGQGEKDNNYVAAQDAVVTYDGTAYKTNSAGTVKIPKVDTEIQVSKDGYSTRTITAEQLEESESVYLEKTSENPVVNAVWIDGVNVLHDTYTLNLTAGKTTTMTADIDWGNSKAKSVTLVQEGKEENFSGNTLSMVLRDKFDVSKTMYILAVNEAGNATRYELQIEENSAVPGLEDVSLSLGESAELTLPASWPLVGKQKVKLDTPTTGLPIEAVVDDGKVYVTIGVDLKKYTSSDKYATNSKTKNRAHVLKKETKGLFDNIKDAMPSGDSKNELKKSFNKVKNLKQTYKTAMKYPQGSFGFTADFTMLGFLEGTIDDNGNLTFLNSGLILNPSVSADWSGQFSVGPVPCYWEAAIKADLQAKLNLLKSQKAEFLSRGKAEGTIKGSIGGGLGINKVATVGGGGNLTFKPLAEFYADSDDNYFSLTTSVGVYFKVQVACFVYQYEPDALAEKTIDNSKKKSRSKAAAKALNEADIYSEDNYETDDLDYIDEGGGFMEEAAAAFAEADEETVTAADELIFHENSYSRTSPKVVSLAENTKMAVWLDTTESDNNSVQVYYSYYDGEKWSDPAVIDKDGTMDNAPDVCSDGKNAYVIWQDAAEKIDANTDLTALAKNMGITAAVFDPVEETFTVEALTEGGTLDMIPTISADGGFAAAAWVENTGNDWFGSGTNEIWTCTMLNGKWGTAAKQNSFEKPVFALAADCDNQTVNTACAVDTDGDTSTTEDLEIYVNGKQLTDNETVDCAPSFSEHSLYWISDGKMYQSDDLTAEAAKSILPDGVTLPTDQYEIAEDGDNKAILYTSNNGLYSDIYGIFYDKAKDAFGEAICLTKGTACLSAFSAIWEDDTLKMLCNNTAVTGEIAEEGQTEDPYGQTNLVWMTYTNPSGVSIEDCVYDDSNIISGSTLPITLTVKNTGTETLSGIKAEIKNASGATLNSVNITQSVASGASEDYTFNYLIQPEDIGQKYTIECSPLGKEGKTSSCELDLNYEDLAVQTLSWSKKDQDTVMISGTAANLGYSSQNDVLINLYKDYITKEGEDGETVQGTVVKSLKIDQIKSMDTQNVYFEVPYEKNAVYYVEVQPKDTESNQTNNSDFVYFYEKTKDTGRSLSALQVQKEKTTYKVGESLTMKDLQITAEYSDGTKSDVGSTASIDTSAVNMSKAGTYKINVLYEGKTASVTIKVTENNAAGNNKKNADAKTLTVGTKTTQNGAVYKVTGTNAMEYVKPAKKTAAANIPSSVTVNGVKYKVTSIAAKAFKGNKKLKKAVIPATVKKIGKQAFYGCKNLKKITIKTKYLTKKNVGAKAFKGINAKATIKVPKRQLKSYKKMLKSKGVGKKVKIKK